uniref:Uncharacterized protein n=1 Tax=Parascaris univalens TaxID=6257 RepID=A0A915B7D4_PARUN
MRPKMTITINQSGWNESNLQMAKKLKSIDMHIKQHNTTECRKSKMPPCG